MFLGIEDRQRNGSNLRKPLIEKHWYSCSLVEDLGYVTLMHIVLQP